MIADTRYLAGLIGDDGLAALVAGWGGLPLLVPKQVGGAAWLAVLSDEAARRLCDACGGDKIYIPKCDGAERARRDADIIAAYGAGARVADLARQHHLSERWVWAILGRPVSDAGQGRLF